MHALKFVFTLSFLWLFFFLHFNGYSQLNEGLAPLIQNPHSRPGQSLNGQWRFIIDPFENGYYNHRFQPLENGYFKNDHARDKTERVEYNFDESETLQVPGDWNTQKEKLLYYEGTIWYKKSFTFNPTAGQQYFLYFGAVNYEAIVYLNGEKIGRHTGGFTPFNIDVSGKLKQGENFVVVKVDNKREREGVPTVNSDWWNYGGITRDVMILSVPQSYIQDYAIHLKNGPNNIIEGSVTLSESSDKPVTLSIPDLGIEQKIITENGFGTFSFKAKPSLWSPENPSLYQITWRNGNEEIADRVGFRSIETQGEDILLNGKSIYLKGVCIHEEAPFRSGRAFTKEEATTLLTWAKEMGCNYVRLAHYPHNEHMLREADRLGLIVWSEIPVYWTIDWENEETLENARHQLEESISRDHNRASIGLWSVANETPAGEARLTFLKSLISHARTLDSTRLITAASDTHSENEGTNTMIISDPLAEYLDVIGINYYCGWYVGLPEGCGDITWKSNYEKPVIVSEFGGGALQGYHADSSTVWSEEFQVDLYKNNLEMFSKVPFIKGLTPWILMDFMSPRRPLPNIQDNYNRKGVISERGEKKAAYFTLQDFYNHFQWPKKER